MSVPEENLAKQYQREIVTWWALKTDCNSIMIISRIAIAKLIACGLGSPRGLQQIKNKIEATHRRGQNPLTRNEA